MNDRSEQRPDALPAGKAHRRRLWTTGGLYRRAMRLHNALPFHLFRRGRAFPTWHYFFEVTRRCNLRCRMCQYREYFEQHPAAELAEDELTTEEWKRLVDQTGRFSLITFTGGEPWVRRDFAEILEYASRKRKTHVITNGVLLDADRVRACVELAPRKLSSPGLIFAGVSIDGTREIHDRIRGRDGAFDAALEAVRRMARLRAESRRLFPMIHVTAVIQDANLPTLPELPGVLAEAGADVLNLTMEVRFTDLEGLGEVDPETFCGADLALPRIDPTRLGKTLARTRENARKAGIELRLPDMPLREILAYHSGGLDLSRFTCRSAWTNLYVGARGNVYPCFLHAIGNVREASLRELWNNDRMRAFRRRVRKSLFCICQGCCHLECRR